MRMFLKFALCALALAALPCSVLAGPNYGSILNVHGNVTGVETAGNPWSDIPIPATCAELDPNAAPDGNGVEWYVVVATREPARGGEPSDLDIATIIFGLGPYDPADCYLSVWGPAYPTLVTTEVPYATWPEPNSGTAVTWAPNCLQGAVVPVYYFGFYIYANDGTPGGMVQLGDFYPGQEASIISCDIPPEEDAIYAYGAIGCGDDPGEKDCDFPTPVERTTWGQIKNVYR